MLKAMGKNLDGEQKLLQLKVNGGLTSSETNGLRQTCPAQLSIETLLSFFHIVLYTASCADCRVCSRQGERRYRAATSPRCLAQPLLCSVPVGVPIPLELFALETLPLNFCSVIWLLVYLGVFLVLQILLVSQSPVQD